MNNIIHKIRQIYPVSEEALQALLMNMQVRHYPKGTYIVQAGGQTVWFISLRKGSPVPYFITTDKIPPLGSARKVM